MTYNMERREQLVCPVDGAAEPSPRDELGRLEWGMDGVRRTGVRDGRTDGRARGKLGRAFAHGKATKEETCTTRYVTRLAGMGRGSPRLAC